MKNLRGRAEQRGIPLDNDCRKANISTHEYGMSDNRKFCLGLKDCMTDDLLDKCRECGAYCMNAKPLKEVEHE